MSKGLRAKLVKAVASGTGSSGRVSNGRESAQCVVPEPGGSPGSKRKAGPRARCGSKGKKEVVTSVGS